ncbi:MAG TPA: lysylphosphatidylglycerol synthase transmembrane domain-containing protein [Anaerolineae bacterium]|nr:lysylphosphatidylglycerol synthase transmembrane domain-containing protein [Anaerolineae bacterium]
MRRDWLAWFRRRWLWWLVIIGFIIFLVLSRGELATLGQTLLQGDPLWLGAAVLAQSAYYSLYAAQYKYGFATVEVASEVRELIPVMFASIFLRTIVPSGGVSGAAVFVDDAARRGQSAARAAEGSLLVLAVDLSTLLPLVAIALGYLAYRHVLVFYEVFGSVLFALFVASLGAALFTGRLAPHLLRRGLHELQWITNELGRRLQHRPLLPEGWAARNAGDLARAANDIATHQGSLGQTLGVASAAQLTNLATVHLVGQAFGQPLSLGAIIASFSMQAVFSVVTFIPNGLVVAEGVMVAVLTSLGVAFGSAVAITIVYRGLSVWLPLLVGFLFLRQVRSFGGRGR